MIYSQPPAQLNGIVSSDTVGVAGLSVQHQTFQETLIRGSTGFWDNEFDGVLGLARNSLHLDERESNMTAKSTWHNMVDQKVLARNIFSLKLSKSPHEDGEIMFGGVNKSLYTGELKSISTTKLPNPTDPGTKKFFNSGWHISISSITLGNSHFSLSGYTAVLSTSYPGIKLPSHITDKFYDLLPPDYKYIFPFKNCTERGEQPDLTVRLGKKGNVEVKISPWDYLLDMRERQDEELGCLIPFDATEGDMAEEKVVILGSAFLAGVYSVFDHDEGTVSCKLNALKGNRSRWERS